MATAATNEKKCPISMDQLINFIRPNALFLDAEVHRRQGSEKATLAAKRHSYQITDEIPFHYYCYMRAFISYKRVRKMKPTLSNVRQSREK